MLFDHDDATKWCAGPTGWVGFELKEPKVLGQWYTLHAGSESAAYITSGFRLQYLDPEKVSEADYLALDAAGKRGFGERGELEEP